MKRILITGTLAVAILTSLTLTPAATQRPHVIEANTNLTTRLALPVTRAERQSTGRCEDYAAVCEDVAYREMASCDYWGLGDCFCKGQRAYNQCMKEVNCPGVSAEAMQAQGCSCLNKSCVP